MKPIDCKWTNECESYLNGSCGVCAHNRKRNAPSDRFIRANDNDIEKHAKRGEAYVAEISNMIPKVTMYLCPACGATVFMGSKSNEFEGPIEDYCKMCGLKVVYGGL
jgi:hypothetical protein